jgi:DtxR family Mn-dependent transcriptional regulator
MLSFAEENYLKAIYHLSNGGIQSVSTNSISDSLKTKPASVSDMIRKLAAKGVIQYEKYHGVQISEDGKAEALAIIRKHRLWEVFLVEKLKFNWDEVHEIAEQLEHIRSSLLISRLDEFLGFPQYDPHGDPIPDKNGVIQTKPRLPLSNLGIGVESKLISVNDSSDLFLQYLDKLKISIGCQIEIIEKHEFDGSMEILIDKKNKTFVSKAVAENLLVTK